MARISVVINTFNEEKNIGRCLEAVKWADEIIIVDMHSTDKTVEIAKKYTSQIFYYEHTKYVEPARNFAISKAQGDWILVVDADEEISASLKEKLLAIAEESAADYVLLPRKNLIFGTWIQHTGWWPDTLVRFFKKDYVIWKDAIHSVPETKGKELVLSSEKYAIIHHHYDSISQFVHKNFEIYAKEEALEKIKNGYMFVYIDVIRFPMKEFLSRYFAREGYKDGLHGLVLSLLMAGYHFMIFLYIWEHKKFIEINESNFSNAIEQETKKSYKELLYWFSNEKIKHSKNVVEKYALKLKRKLS